MADWYLTITTPTPTVDVWPMGDDSDTALRDARIASAKMALSVPSDWYEFSGWAVSYGPGLPHSSVLAVATLHDDPPAT